MALVEEGRAPGEFGAGCCCVFRAQVFSARCLCQERLQASGGQVMPRAKGCSQLAYLKVPT